MSLTSPSCSGSDSVLAGQIEPQLIVILSDINMPGMDGLTLLREIKKQWPNLPVMMVTAYGDDERRRRASEYRAAEFITKPVDFDQLKKQLQRLPSGAACAPAVTGPSKTLAVEDEA